MALNQSYPGAILLSTPILLAWAFHCYARIPDRLCELVRARLTNLFANFSRNLGNIYRNQYKEHPLSILTTAMICGSTNTTHSAQNNSFWYLSSTRYCRAKSGNRSHFDAVPKYPSVEEIPLRLNSLQEARHYQQFVSALFYFARYLWFCSSRVRDVAKR